MTALKSIVPEQFFVIKKSMQEITDPNHESANSSYVAMLMEQREFLKEEQFLKNSIIQSLTNQYNNVFNSTTTFNSYNNSNSNTNNNNNDDDNNSNNLQKCNNNHSTF